MRRTLVLMFLFASAAVVRADEGRIPIHEPTTITESGHYFLTRDLQFGVEDEDAIVIEAQRVTLDLNGHSVTNTGTGYAGIHIEDDANDVVIRNGRLVGWVVGVWGGSPTPSLRVRIERLQIRDCWCGMILTAGHAEIVANQVSDVLDGIVVGGGSVWTGSVTDNVVLRSQFLGIALGPSHGALIRSNIVSEYCLGGPAASWGIDVAGEGNLIIENVVTGGDVGNFCHGIQVRQPGRNVVAHNVSVGMDGPDGAGIGVLADGHLILGNVANGNTTHGIHFWNGGAEDSLVSGNQLSGNGGVGIWYDVSDSGQAYRNNMLRGNAGGAVEDSTGAATDEGGNIY